MSYYRQGLRIGSEIPPESGKGSETLSVAIVLGLTGLLLVTSPGGKHLMRHGRLPK